MSVMITGRVFTLSIAIDARGSGIRNPRWIEQRRRIDLSHVLRVGALFADWRAPHRACTEPIAIAAGRHPTKYTETGKKICGRILTTRCYTDDVKNYIRALPDLSSGNTVANIFIS